jgi:hypothetical protein
MKATLLLVTALALPLSVSNLACDTGSPASTGAPGPGGAGGGQPPAGIPAPAPVPGSGTPAPAPGTATPPAPGAADETLCGAVQLAAAKSVPAGKTLAICAGSTVTMAAGVSLTVQGKLVVQGTAQSPVKLVGAQGGTMDWAGLIIEANGAVSASYLQIRNAETALTTRPGSSFSIDHLVIESSEALMVLGSSGTIAHGTLHGLGDKQSSTPIEISDASPRITDTVVSQGAFNGVDMIVVGGDTAAPVFDRLEVADSHCAFHFVTGNGVTISNSYLHHNAYGLMVTGSTGGHVVHNNFQDNGINIGTCSGGTSEVKDNYFDGAAFDRSCVRLMVTGAAPAAPYPTGVGPTP